MREFCAGQDSPLQVSRRLVVTGPKRAGFECGLRFAGIVFYLAAMEEFRAPTVHCIRRHDR